MGTCKWVDMPESAHNGLWLQITVERRDGTPVSRLYEIEPVLARPGRGPGYVVRHYAGATLKEFRIYEYFVDCDRWQCNCPDAAKHQGQCKHVLALRAALARLPF